MIKNKKPKNEQSHGRRLASLCCSGVSLTQRSSLRECAPRPRNTPVGESGVKRGEAEGVPSWSQEPAAPGEAVGRVPCAEPAPRPQSSFHGHFECVCVCRGASEPPLDPIPGLRPSSGQSPGLPRPAGRRAESSCLPTPAWGLILCSFILALPLGPHRAGLPHRPAAEGPGTTWVGLGVLSQLGPTVAQSVLPRCHRPWPPPGIQVARAGSDVWRGPGMNEHRAGGRCRVPRVGRRPRAHRWEPRCTQVSGCV